jgi:CYTH domain-containing protein
MKFQEKKFILKTLPEGLSGIDMKRAYLMFEGNMHLSVRIINNASAFLIFKTLHTDIVRTEYEYEISFQDAIEMFNTSKCKLQKTRYRTTFEGNHVDIDVFPSGKAVVEIAFENELEEIPPYCGDEVTGQKEWSNVSMAQSGIFSEETIISTI